jgi:release factor glutamine methyltransferase
MSGGNERGPDLALDGPAAAAPAVAPGVDGTAATSAAAAAWSTVGEAHDALALALAGPLAPPARAEARDLIAAVLDVPRFWPSGNAGRPLSSDEATAIAQALARRLQGMPLAYAAQRAAFRTLSLHVDQRVLIPRPETELLVEIVLDATKRGQGTAVDIGTGSGAIALALAAEGDFDAVIGTDLSPDALAVAEGNRQRLAPAAAAKLRWLQGDGVAPLEAAGIKAQVLVSNPPYISPDEAAELPALVRDWEPHLALFAADEGMAMIAQLASGAARIAAPGALLALEVDSRRAGRAAELVTAANAWRDVVVRPDLTGRARFVLARRAES